MKAAQFNALTAIRAAERARHLFRGSFSRWDSLGCVRRLSIPTPDEVLVHLVRPRPAGADSRFPHLVWQKASALFIEGLIFARDMQVLGDLVDADVSSIEFDAGGFRHRLCLGSAETWGVRMAQYTGPALFFEKLLYRLRHAGALTLHRGLVCSIDRSLGNGRESLQPIECRDERTFFRLARTRWKEPHERSAGQARRDWARGMEPEWYPPGVKVYADPSTNPELFNNSRDVDPRFVGKDVEAWLHR